MRIRFTTISGKLRRSLPAALAWIALSAMAAGPAGANPGALTLEQAIARAVSWHPSIDEAIARYNQDAEQINVARSGYFPSVTGGLSMDYTSSGTGDWAPKLDLSLSQMIFDFGKVESAVEAATAATRAGRARVLLGVDSLILQTGQTALQIQRHKELLAVARSHVASVSEIRDLVQERTDRGANSQSDIVQANVRVQAAEAMAIEIEGALGRARLELASLIGSEGAVDIIGEVPRRLAASCDRRDINWAAVPAVMQADAQWEEAMAQFDRAQAEAFPTLSLQAGTSANLYDIGNAPPDFRIGLSLSGSLYDGGARGASANAAGHAVRAANMAVQTARLEVENTIVQARQMSATYAALIESMTYRNALLQIAAELSRHQYFDLGTKTLMDVLDAERELHQALFESVNSSYDRYNLQFDCIYNTGAARATFNLEGMVVKGVFL